MYLIEDSEYISHYGIMGMRWGKRNGPPYPLDRAVSRKIRAEGKAAAKAQKAKIAQLKSESANEYKQTWAKEDLAKIKAKTKLQLQRKPSKAQLKYEQEYLAKGYSKEDAAIAAFNKDRTRKALLIVGGVTLAAVVGYSLYKRGQLNTDSIIKSGSTMRRVANDSSTKLHDAFYASPNKLDNLKYRGAYGGGQQMGAMGVKEIFNKTIQATKDIKIAGGKSGRRIVSSALAQDKQLADKYARMVHTFGLGNGHIARNIEAGRIGRKEYEAINRALVIHDTYVPGADAAHKKLYDAFRKAGYDAVKDVNDMKYSGYRAKLPVIVFNGNAATVKSVTKLSKSSLRKDLVKAYAAMMAPDVAKTIGIFAGLNIGSRALSKNIVERERDDIVAAYKKKHPNTKMTYNEIFRSEAERLKLEI